MKKYIRNFKPKGFQKGDLNPSRNPERRKEISEWRKKQKLSTKTKKRISVTLKRRLKEPELKEKWGKSNLGKKHSKENIDKVVATRKKNHPPSIKRLTQKLDEVFSRYKRLANSNEHGYIQCFTCERLFPYAEIDCGHFVSRQHRGLRWSEENTEPQCRSCNRFHEGVKDVFALKLQRKYGMDILQKLNDIKEQYTKFTPQELIDLIEYYKTEIASMEGK